VSWYKANSGGPPNVMDVINKNCIDNLPDYLNFFLDSVFSNYSITPKFVDIDELVFNDKIKDDARVLREVLDQEGSDKGYHHHYNKLYAYVFDLMNLQFNKGKLLEIGLGTNNPQIASNMGLNGRPGASIRGFQKFIPSIEIHGADIDSDIVVEGFKTYIVDQLDPVSFELIKEKGAMQYDVIIDDGLHSPEANINTLSVGLSMVKKGGVLVVEDIATRSLCFWEAISKILMLSGYDVLIVNCRPKGSNCLIVGNKLTLPLRNC